MRRETTLLVLTTLALSALGALMVYSVDAARPGGGGYFAQHCAYLGIGLALFLFFFHMDYHLLGNERVFRYVVIIAVILLVLVLVPGIGTKVGGARRWIRVFGRGFQPSEFAKFALVLLLAVKLTQNQAKMQRFWRGIAVPFLMAGFFAGLVALEKDIGIPLVMMVMAYVMVFIAGGRLLYLGGMAGVGAAALTVMILVAPHRVARMIAFWDPWAQREGDGWQLIQSLSAFAQGGLWGRGAGAGEQKLGYLPAAHTDFIFATVGEEFGLFGTLSVLLLIVLFTWAALRVAANARDLFGTLLASGVCTLISFQAAFIIAVTLGLLPTKGLPLPLVSYGGSALMATLAMAGMLANIGSQAEEERRPRPERGRAPVGVFRRRRAAHSAP
ncbi:MAG: putative lipid II flippase FtsW [Candidatus Hydrogenedens sp.]|nr:putative lipid II flippase FtsW [Candidatus Hydrogenedens sp.]